MRMELRRKYAQQFHSDSKNIVHYNSVHIDTRLFRFVWGEHVWFLKWCDFGTCTIRSKTMCQVCVYKFLPVRTYNYLDYNDFNSERVCFCLLQARTCDEPKRQQSTISPTVSYRTKKMSSPRVRSRRLAEITFAFATSCVCAAINVRLN